VGDKPIAKRLPLQDNTQKPKISMPQPQSMLNLSNTGNESVEERSCPHAMKT